MSKPRYKTAEEMQAVIDRYFADCAGEVLKDADGCPMLDKFGNPLVTGVRPPTVTGLALALGFTSRLALINYQSTPAFVNTVTRAKARIEAYAESRLYDRDGQRGAEFSLRHNFKWAGEATTSDNGVLDVIAAYLKTGVKREGSD